MSLFSWWAILATSQCHHRIDVILLGEKEYPMRTHHILDIIAAYSEPSTLLMAVILSESSKCVRWFIAVLLTGLGLTFLFENGGI